MTYSVWAINWTESERGWGQRPNGHTLHLSKEDAKAYISSYWDGMPNETPDCYSYPSDPFLVKTDEENYKRLKNAEIFSKESKSVWGHTTNWAKKA